MKKHIAIVDKTYFIKGFGKVKFVKGKEVEQDIVNKFPFNSRKKLFEEVAEKPAKKQPVKKQYPKKK